jgi:hypothetical protein
MKKILYIILTNITVLISYSQIDSSRNALQFNFVNQTSLSYRYKTTDYSELRTTIDIAAKVTDKRTYDNPVYYFNSDSLLYKYDEVNSSNEEYIRFSIDYLFTFYRHKSVSMYLGVGPFISLSCSQYISTHEYSNQEVRTSNNTYYQWMVGGIISVGLECQVYELVSMLGEYTGTIGYGYEKTRPIKYPDTRIISFQLGAIHIGVCICF